jgi:sulfhydrogenase subunit beta (sulfur reductase)
MANGAHTIAKRDVAGWIAALMERAEVIAPVAAHGGDVAFAPISSPEQVLFQFSNTLQPPKQFVLPQTDPLLVIRRNGGGIEVEPVHDEPPRVIFNIRSCDAVGFGFLHRMHASDLPDGAYLARAGNVALVSLACTVPCELGFCTCCDAGPFLEEGTDIQLTDLGESLLAEPGSDKGRALLSEAADLFRPARPEEMQRRVELEEEAKRRFGEETCHFASAMRRVSTGRVAEELWGAMGDWCLECGGCNFVCPTCYCFSVKDMKQDGSWVRCRTWDSCQYQAFTAEASGHNPRERHGDRIKRRFFHKVSAQYYLRDGTVGCVGCGRCVRVCLGTTDMPAVVAAIREGAWHG